MIADIFLATAAALAVVATTPAVPARPAPPAPIVEQVAVVDTDDLVPVEITLTSYTCDYHPNNPMTTTPGMCQHTASGNDPRTPGIACPPDWMGREVYLPDHGWRVCDDTGAFDVIHGRIHLDLRTDTWEDALRVGLGAYTVYVYGGLP